MAMFVTNDPLVVYADLDIIYLVYIFLTTS